MACADSDRAARLTVDILSSLKTCPASLFSSLCSDCQTIVKRYSSGGDWGEGQKAAFQVKDGVSKTLYQKKKQIKSKNSGN